MIARASVDFSNACIGGERAMNSRKRIRGSWLLVGALLLVGTRASGVILDGMNQCTVKLSDGTDVVLYGEFISKLTTRGTGSTEPLVPFDRVRRVGVIDPNLDAGVKTRDVGDGSGARQARKDQDKAIEAQRGRMEELKRQYAGAIDKDKKFERQAKSNRFYYLPPNSALHLSKRPDGTPEFLFVRYTTDKKESEGGTQGGLMHFLMELGMSKAQEDELRLEVARRCKGDEGNGVLVGAVEINEAEDKGSFKIISATLSDTTMTKSMVQSGHAPVLPGGKLAAAANLSANGAQLFLSTVEKKKGSVADLSVELDYSYVVQLPAAKGAIFFHWSKMSEAAEQYMLDYESKSKGGWFRKDELHVTKEQLQQFMNFAAEKSVVEFVFEGYNPDSEFTKMILQAMTDYFLNSMMDAQDKEPELALADDDDKKGQEEPVKQAEGKNEETTYKINKRKLAQSWAQKDQVIKLEAGLAVRKKFSVVGNLASWYNGVKDNPRCVQAVNLNDPFFQHRDVRFILDLDAKDIFEKMVNYATVNVRKRRSNGSEFNDSLTIDQDYLKTKGIAGNITYARMDDTNTEAYEYMTQWSVRGGHLFPAQPRWQKGSWEGVTLAPPIEEWTIEAEGDTGQMEASNIARVSVEIHYPTFGEEQTKIIALSPKTGDEIHTEKIYVDRGTKGFAYRLIVHHKTEGRMVLPWQARIGERYVYATLPEEVLTAGNPRAQAIEAAKKLGKAGSEKVLDQFQELFATAD
jgi:hypothetical protein